MPHLSLSRTTCQSAFYKVLSLLRYLYKNTPRALPAPLHTTQLSNLGYTDSTDYVSTKTRRTQTARILRHRPLTARFLVS